METSQRKFYKIPAARPLTVVNQIATSHKKRVCAYCRVSTEVSEQISSYHLQIGNYTQFIKSNADWEFEGVFADYAKSGTSTEKRTEFMRMIQACKEGRIDLVITKSISRFARNTLDCLNYVRMLKSLVPPVGIYFEKENINTLDAKSELLLTILSSIAQDEARNISENTKWSIRKKYQSGQARCPSNFLLGYENDDSGNLIINEKEAETVRRIFHEYINGKGAQLLAKELKSEGVLSGRGTINWGKNSVLKILRNEKYCGDVLMQKDYTIDFLTHKRKKNIGELPQYYIENHHPPIISRTEWNTVQNELKRRHDISTIKDRNHRQAYSSVSVFSNHFFCGHCGQPLNRSSAMLLHDGKKENAPIWRCRATSAKNCARGGYTRCQAKRKQEIKIKESFMRMLLELKAREEYSNLDKENTLHRVFISLEDNVEFKDEYFRDLIDRGVVYNDGRIEYTFKSGMKVTSFL